MICILAPTNPIVLKDIKDVTDDIIPDTAYEADTTQGFTVKQLQIVGDVLFPPVQLHPVLGPVQSLLHPLWF